MKIKSATQAIAFALARGSKLTTQNGFGDFGTSHLPSRVGEIEKKYSIRCNRKDVEFTSKYGVKGKCYEYQLPLNQRKKLREMLVKEYK